jgi:hypothetical protein
MIAGMSAPAPDLTLESRLCLACGLCCDGTLYEDAKIREDEVRDVESIGLTTSRNAQGHPTFVFACRYLDGACCARYEQWRPSVCSKFFCRVQQRARAGELTEEQAMEKIAAARQLVTEVKATLPAGMPIVEARHHFTRIAAKKPDLSPMEARFAVKMFVLERFLDLEFRKPDKGHLPAERRSSIPA